MSIPQKPAGDPNKYEAEIITQELFRCEDQNVEGSYGFIYWLANYCKIRNNDARGYVHFIPWASQRAIDNGYDDQVSTAKKLQVEDRLIALKARQVGLTTLVLAYYLWDMLFHPIAYVLLLSKGDDEAKELLVRMKLMYKHLPHWMKVQVEVRNSSKKWLLSNESIVLSLSSRRGDSYSSTHCLIDEAALLNRANTSLQQVLLNLEPTVGQKGKLFLISKNDKARSKSTFVSMYKAAQKHKSEYVAGFIPYYVVPGRDEKWYAGQEADSKSIDGTLDMVHESYPKEPAEALAPKSSSKRLAPTWLTQCHVAKSTVDIPDDAPNIAGLVYYRLPQPGSKYVIAGDSSEGLVHSDPSAIIVMDILTKEEVAVFARPVEPSVLGSYMDRLGKYYYNAKLIFELNEHGHALKMWLQNNSALTLLKGWAVKQSLRKIGWTTGAVSKVLLYDTLAKALKNSDCIINDQTTFDELQSIEQATLRAPKKENDDQAMAYALAVAAIELCMEYTFQVDFMTIG